LLKAGAVCEKAPEASGHRRYLHLPRNLPEAQALLVQFAHTLQLLDDYKALAA
jgi:hypothetical protein